MKVYLPIALVLGFALVNVIHCTVLLGGAATGLTVGVGAATAATAATIAAIGATLGAISLGVVTKSIINKGKRDVASCLPFKSTEFYLNMAANADFLDCGRKFVCEVEATDYEKLSGDERGIRNLFLKGTSFANGTAGSFFAEAGLLGATEGIEACARVFYACPLDRKGIFQAFKDAQKI